jgi:hypothetical protein
VGATTGKLPTSGRGFAETDEMLLALELSFVFSMKYFMSPPFLGGKLFSDESTASTFLDRLASKIKPGEAIASLLKSEIFSPDFPKKTPPANMTIPTPSGFEGLQMTNPCTSLDFRAFKTTSSGNLKSFYRVLRGCPKT